MNRYLLIDGNNMLMRAVHASQRNGVVMSTEDGVNTAALVIFINLLSRHIREESPTHLVVCWDGGRSAFRTGLYPDYKAHRPDRAETADERGPFAQAKEFCTLAGMHHVERPGWEADDLIAAYWQNTRRTDPGGRIVILSGDKDLLQLLDDHTYQVRPATPPAGTDRWDAWRVGEHYEVPPKHLSKAMAMIGDTGDNVPGVRGIGPKKAAKALAAGGWTLEGALHHLKRGDDLADARLWHALVDLRDMRYAKHGLHVTEVPTFTPTSFGGVLTTPLLQYLDRYALEGVKARLAAQTLWRDEPREAANVRDPRVPL